VSVGADQQITITGAVTFAFSNWPATGHRGEVEIEITNGGNNITWPTINWIIGDGTTSTTFTDMGVVFATAGVNHAVVWTRDGGTTLYGVAA